MDTGSNCDHLRRSIQKTVSEWNGSTYTPVQTNTFIWDGWNIVAETCNKQSVVTTNFYTWGLDLAGQRSGLLSGGAGGIGGLLAITVNSNSTQKTYLPIPDHIGNINKVLDLDTDQVIAEYTYSPFGVVVHESSDIPDVCSMRFMSKYYDSETELCYFGYRYYHAATAKWLSRDPLEESAGPNITQMCRNDPVNNFDALGERAYGNNFVGPVQEPYDWIEESYTQEQVDDVYAVLAIRDKHIYNPGLANESDRREGNRRLLERILGVPVEGIWNPTFGELG
jgi:RHS repeat-associated protein